MLFNSLSFLFFFPAACILYYLTPGKWRWLTMLASGVWFYMSFIPWYMLILALAIVVDYSAAIFIENADGAKKKYWLILSILSTVAILFFFKYFDFFSANAARITGLIGWHYSPLILKIVLPIGLSFHTFQSLSYVIEVYRGNFKAEKHFGYYALYVMFYPQLVAGPIERPQHLLPQLRMHHSFQWDNLISGLLRMLWGFIKKMVIADRIAYYVNIVYSDPGQHAGANSWMVVYLFAIQIYCDFSGYTDIALGAAKIMGIDLMENFKQPYLAASIREFWHRWHISLSSWFRDYIYIPLGGNQNKNLKWILAILFTFALSGFWHGAHWNFIIWGGIHGIALLIASAISGEKKGNFISWLITLQVVCLAWIFFRANGLNNAIQMYCNLNHSASLHTPFDKAYECISDMLVLALFVPLMFISEYKLGNNPVYTMIEKRTISWQWGISWLMLFLFLSFAEFRSPQTFIYFQF